MIREPLRHRKPSVRTLFFVVVGSIILGYVAIFTLQQCGYRAVYSGIVFDFARLILLLSGIVLPVSSLMLFIHPGLYVKRPKVAHPGIKLTLCIIVLIILLFGTLARSAGVLKIGEEAWSCVRLALMLIIFYVLITVGSQYKD